MTPGAHQLCPKETSVSGSLLHHYRQNTKPVGILLVSGKAVHPRRTTCPPSSAPTLFPKNQSIISWGNRFVLLPLNTSAVCLGASCSAEPQRRLAQVLLFTISFGQELCERKRWCVGNRCLLSAYCAFWGDTEDDDDWWGNLWFAVGTRCKFYLWIYNLGWILASWMHESHLLVKRFKYRCVQMQWAEITWEVAWHADSKPGKPRVCSLLCFWLIVCGFWRTISPSYISPSLSTLWQR